MAAEIAIGRPPHKRALSRLVARTLTLRFDHALFDAVDARAKLIDALGVGLCLRIGCLRFAARACAMPSVV